MKYGVFKETDDWMLGLKEIFGQILLIFQTSAHRYPPIDDPVLLYDENNPHEHRPYADRCSQQKSEDSVYFTESSYKSESSTEI